MEIIIKIRQNYLPKLFQYIGSKSNIYISEVKKKQKQKTKNKNKNKNKKITHTYVIIVITPFKHIIN